MNFPCCCGSDENPPEHTQDCEVFLHAKKQALAQILAVVNGMKAGTFNSPKGLKESIVNRLQIMLNEIP